MWLKLLLAVFVICVLGAVYGVYRLHLYAGPKAKKAEKQAEIDRQTWLQQKHLVFEETDQFLDTVSLPSSLLEPRIYNQQLELLKYPDRKRFGDWRYESNEELIVAPLQEPLHGFLDSLKKKGLSVKGFEDEFLAELVRRISSRNYRHYAAQLGDFIREGQDFQGAVGGFFDLLGIDKNEPVRPSFIVSLSNYYKEPMVFKTTARGNQDFTEGIGMLDFLQKYLQFKGVTTNPMPIKELHDKLEEVFKQYAPMDGQGE